MQTIRLIKMLIQRGCSRVCLSLRGVAMLLAIALPVLTAAAEVEVVLPPLSESSTINEFVLGDNKRIFFTRAEALCDFDIARKFIKCMEHEGKISSLQSVSMNGKPMLFYLESQSKLLDSQEICSVTLHSYDPEKKAKPIVKVLFDMRCWSHHELELFASTTGVNTFITVVIPNALRVYRLEGSPETFTAHQTWSYSSELLLDRVMAAVTNERVWVGMRSDFETGAIVELTSYSLLDQKTSKIRLEVPPDISNFFPPSYFLVSPDDGYLLLVGQTGASPGEFATYDLKTKKFQCSFVNRDLRALDRFRDIVFDKNSQRILVASVNGELLELDLCGTVKERLKIDYLIANIPTDLWGLQQSQDEHFLYSLFRDGIITITDTVHNQLIATLFFLQNDEWLILLPEGYYNASLHGHDHLGILHKNQIVDLNQFYDVFYRPDIVDRRLTGRNIDDLLFVTIQEAIESPPPKVEFLTAPAETQERSMPIRYRITSTGGGIGEVRVYHNGKLVWSDGIIETVDLGREHSIRLEGNTSEEILRQLRGVALALDTSDPKRSRSVVRAPPKGKVYENILDINLISGRNEITLTAFNAGNTVQSKLQTKNFISNAAPVTPSLYILAVGIDKYRSGALNLKFAAKDAKDMYEKLRRQVSTLYSDERIHTQLLTDEAATREGILAELKSLQDHIQPEDEFILFVASHGLLKDNQYYLVTHDYDGAISKTNVISSNEIVEASRRIRAMNQLLIFDTCHAGGVDDIVAALYDTRISMLARKMGLHIYAAAESLQLALDGYQGNGLFTHVLINGLDNNADTDVNRDRKVSIEELGDYTKRITSRLSDKIGHNQTPLIVKFGEDRALYKLQNSAIH